MAFKKVLILIGICLGVAVGAFIFSAVNTALASIQREFNASINQLQWIMNIFGIVICSTLVIFGKLADLYGRKCLFLIGLIALAISMFGSGIAFNIYWVIGSQAILGLSGAIIIPVSQALLSDTFPLHERSKAIGIWAAVMGLAMAIGPLLSGFIITLVGWRWIFLINIPIIFLSFILIVCFSSESQIQRKKISTIDLKGAFFLFFMVLTFVLAVIESDWPTYILIILYSLSAISLVFLWITETHAEEPIIQKQILRHRTFLSSSLSNFFLVFFNWACFFLLPLYLQNIHHFQPYQAGVLMLFITAPLTIFSFISGYLYQNLNPRTIILIGFIFLTISALIQTHLNEISNLINLIVSMLAFGIGWGLIWGPTITAATSSLPIEIAGVVAGTFVTIQEIGGTLGLAITGSIVRIHHNFLIGYHYGMWVLVLICAMGFISTLFINISKNQSKPLARLK